MQHGCNAHQQPETRPKSEPRAQHREAEWGEIFGSFWHHLYSQGWVANAVITAALGLVFILVSQVMKNPKTIVIGAIVGLTLLLWTFGFILYRSIGESSRTSSNEPAQSIPQSRLYYPTPPAPPNSEPQEQKISNAIPPSVQQKETSKNMPEQPKGTNRSVKLGDGTKLTNSAIVTGDNSKVDIHAGPPDPFVLNSSQQDKMAEVLKGHQGESVALVGIGRGRRSLDSVTAALVAGTWKLNALSPIGSFTSHGESVDISIGVHIMENGAREQKVKALKAALKVAGIGFDMAPWDPPLGALPPGLDLCLIIGDPK